MRAAPVPGHRRLGLAAEQQVGEAKNGYAHQNEKIKAKWNHDCGIGRGGGLQQNKA